MIIEEADWDDGARNYGRRGRGRGRARGRGRITKARPAYTKARPTVFTKKALPPRPLVCNWWSNQHVVEPYRGISQHSFKLRPYGSADLEDYVSIPGKKQFEMALLTNIQDALSRVKNALAHAPQYFTHGQANDIAARLKSSQTHLNAIGPIYNEWANKPYRILGMEYEGYGDESKKSDPVITGNTLWPLDETLAENFYLHDLFSTRADVNEMSIDLRAGTWVLLWRASPRESMHAFTKHFENWHPQLLGTAAMSRLNAIKSIRNAYAMAAHEARCAEVLTARAISYGQNKAAFISSQR
jgi:hypothetical protein